MLMIPTEILVGKIDVLSRQVSPASLLGDCRYYQRTLVDQSGMIRTHMGKYSRSVMVAVYGTPCAIPPRKQ
jgi:hypothetical protein